MIFPGRCVKRFLRIKTRTRLEVRHTSNALSTLAFALGRDDTLLR